MGGAGRLVLWDIDQTLVDLSGMGGRWYTDALARVTGVTLRELPDFGGRTELAITTEVLTRHRLEVTEELIGRMWRELTVLCAQSLREPDRHGRALPGAATALSTVASQGAVQSLVTGNLPEVAERKLAAFDLTEHLDLEIGGYGSLSADRHELVGHAIERAGARHGRDFDPAAVAVVGDTPHDVHAALAHGAIAVAVTTGRHGAEELRDFGAHRVLPGLHDTGAVLAAVLG